MAEFEKKEQYEGRWDGRDVHFSRVWRGYRLSDAECRRLCAGETIEINGLVSKAGNKYGVIAKLADLEYNGHQYVGVDQVGFAKRGIPSVFLTHAVTEDERALLEAGKPVRMEGLVGKSGKKFGAKVRYDESEDKMILDFDN